MQHQEFEPPEQLRDSIKCFWYDTRDLGAQLSAFEVMPDGFTEIIFHFGAGCSVYYNGSLTPLPSPFMVGLLHQPITFYAQGRLQVIGIRCFPWAVFDLLGLPSGNKALTTFEHPIAALVPTLERSLQAGDITHAIDHLDQYFSTLHSALSAGTMLFKAGKAMLKANGTLPVSGVAAAAHATVRTLERNFKRSSGHTVKNVSSLMRFEQVRDRLWLEPNVDLAGMAHEMGYTDQAHLSRDFKRYAGVTPAAFARKAKQQRMIDAQFVAFIQDR